MTEAIAPIRVQQRRRGVERRSQIVEVVLELIAECGAQAVSAQAIADRIGITQPAVFRHFPNKEAMWGAVMVWLDARLTEIHGLAAAHSHEPALTVLRRMFLGHVLLVERHPALAKVVFSDHLRLQFPALQDSFASISDLYRKRLLGLIARAKAEKTVSPDLRAADAATLFLCMVQGLAFQFAIARRPMQLRREAERVFDLYERGIAAAVQ